MSTTGIQRVVATADAEPPSISQDTAFELLSCRRRRYVIHSLKQRSGRVALRELVVQVAAWENDCPPAEVTYDERMRVYTALRQSHLPKLDDGGIVEFDANRGTIELTDAASELEVYLDVVPHNDIPWSKYYAGLGVLSAGFVAGLWTGVEPFSFLPPLVGAAIVTTLFTLSALAHVRYDRRMRLGSDGTPPEGYDG